MVVTYTAPWQRSLARLLVGALAALFILVPTTTALAVDPGGFVTCEGTECSFCNLVDMGQLIIFWVIGFIIILFMIILVIAGFRLVTSGGDEEAREDAKRKLTNGLIGIIIVLAAWLMVDTLMRAVLPGDEGVIAGWGPWSQVQCFVQTEALEFVREGAAAADPTQEIVAPAAPGATGDGLSQAEAEGALAGAGVAVSSSGGCSDPANSTCTSLEGMQAATVDEVLELTDAVGSDNVVVTGGTETGHSRSGPYRHDNGYKVDLRTTDELNTYIETNYEPVAGRANTYRDPEGNIYYRHGPVDHWDVTVTN